MGCLRSAITFLAYLVRPYSNSFAGPQSISTHLQPLCPLENITLDLSVRTEESFIALQAYMYATLWNRQGCLYSKLVGTLTEASSEGFWKHKEAMKEYLLQSPLKQGTALGKPLHMLEDDLYEFGNRPVSTAFALIALAILTGRDLEIFLGQPDMTDSICVDILPSLCVRVRVRAKAELGRLLDSQSTIGPLRLVLVPACSTLETVYPDQRDQC